MCGDALLKMASGLISPSGHSGQLCTGGPLHPAGGGILSMAFMDTRPEEGQWPPGRHSGLRYGSTVAITPGDDVVRMCLGRSLHGDRSMYTPMPSACLVLMSRLAEVFSTA